MVTVTSQPCINCRNAVLNFEHAQLKYTSTCWLLGGHRAAWEARACDAFRPAGLRVVEIRHRAIPPLKKAVEGQ